MTDLLFGGKISKTDSQVEALGAVDELNASLGLVRVVMEGEGAEAIDQVQKWLVTLMGELAMPAGKEEEYERAGFGRIGEEEISWVEEWSSGMSHLPIHLDPGTKSSETWTSYYNLEKLLL